MLHSIALDTEGEVLRQRHAAWWRREGVLLSVSESPPLGNLWLPLADGSLAQTDMALRPEYLDVDRLAGERYTPGPLQVRGDHFETTAPYVRIPWVEAILGAPIWATIQGGSMRSHKIVENWDEWPALAEQKDQAWFDLLRRLTEEMAVRSAGRVAVVQTLMRGASDIAEALLGHEMMCFSIYDYPQQLARFLEKITDGFIEILLAQIERIPRVAGGVVSPFGIWAPGTVVRGQCDASAILSASHYADWFLPHDIRMCQAVDYSIMHLHSCSLHTVPALLEGTYPHAIQVTLDPAPSGPPVTELLPILRRVLEHKPLIVEGPLSAAEVDWLLERLPPTGLSITARRLPW
jgi:hypothetical protein